MQNHEKNKTVKYQVLLDCVVLKTCWILELGEIFTIDMFIFFLILNILFYIHRHIVPMKQFALEIQVRHRR